MSWKQYGGVNKTDTATKFTIGSIVTDNLVERTQLAGEFKVEGNALITGRLNVGDIITNDINVDNDITINNNATINKLLLGTSNKVIFSNQEGLSINHENPLNELDVLGQENIAKFKSTTDSVANILAMTNENKGIMCGSTKIDETNYESYITFFNGLTYDPITKKNNVSVEQTDVKMSFSTLNNGEFRVDADTFEFGDGSHKIFAYESYERKDIYTGFSLKLRSTYNDFSNTAAKLTSKEGKGILIGGGASPNYIDKLKEFGYFGLIDELNDFLPFFVAERSNNSYNKKFHLGFNTYKPKRRDSLLDVNGKMSINYSEVSFVATDSFEPKKVSFHPKHNNLSDRRSYFAISGSAKNKNVPYRYNILYTIDGGKTWQNSPVVVTENQALNTSAGNLILSNFLPEESDDTDKYGLHFISASNNSFFYANTFSGMPVYNENNQLINEGGWSFFTISGVDATSSHFRLGSDFTNIAVYYLGSGIDKKLRLVFTENINIDGFTEINNIRNEQTFYIDLDNTFINLIKTNSLSIITFEYLVENNLITDIPFLPVNFKDFVFLDDGNILAYGQGIYKLNEEFIEITNNSRHNTNKKYNDIFAYENRFYVAVGDNIISLSRDKGDSWTDIIISEAIQDVGRVNPVLNSIYVLDEYIGVDNMNNPIELGNMMAVGDEGLFVYSLDRGNTWIKVPDEAIDGSGTGERIYGLNNKLLNIYIEDTSNMVITRRLNTFVPGGTDVNLGQDGELMVHYLSIPYLFNYKSVDVLDICGNLTVQGDIRLNDGELMSNKKVFNFINRKEEILNMGANLKVANVGKDSDTVVKLNGNIVMSDTLVVGVDVDTQIDQNYKIDLTGNMTHDGYVHQF